MPLRSESQPPLMIFVTTSVSETLSTRSSSAPSSSRMRASGWTSFGSPGAYQAGAVRFIDPQCEALGGVPTGTVGGVGGAPTAGTHA